MANENEKQTREVKMDGLHSRGRGGGQPKPKTPSGERKQWTPPKRDTTPSNRGDGK